MRKLDKEQPKITFTDVNCPHPKRNHPNIEAIKLIVLCDLCAKICVQYAKR